MAFSVLICAGLGWNKKKKKNEKNGIKTIPSAVGSYQEIQRGLSLNRGKHKNKQREKK